MIDPSTTETERGLFAPPETAVKRWWRYAVLRGSGIPAAFNGRWYDLEGLDVPAVIPVGSDALLVPTDRWEQREDGEVAVVYEWRR